MLAAASHGERAALAPLARSGLRLGPGGWQRFLRDSRIFERSSARIRARLLARRARGNGAPGS